MKQGDKASEQVHHQRRLLSNVIAGVSQFEHSIVEQKSSFRLAEIQSVAMMVIYFQFSLACYALLRRDDEYSATLRVALEVTPQAS